MNTWAARMFSAAYVIVGCVNASGTLLKDPAQTGARSMERRARATEKFPVFENGPYPQKVQTDHEIWRTLPREIRAATMEAISALERQFRSAPNTGTDEKEFNNELRAGLLLAVGVLQEAAAGAGPRSTTSSKTGKA